MLPTDERVLRAEERVLRAAGLLLQAKESPQLRESGAFQSPKGQLIRGKKGGRAWGDAAGETGTRSCRACRLVRVWILFYQCREVIAGLSSGAEGNSSFWKIRYAITHILLKKCPNLCGGQEDENK